MPRKKTGQWFICPNCENSFYAKPSRGTPLYCSKECRTADSKMIVRCKQCDEPFETYKNNPQKYCTVSCGITARNLTDQNPSYHRDVSGKNNPMYGKGLHGPDNPMYGKKAEQNPAWRGGRKVRKDGYAFVYAPDHPYAIASGKGARTYVLEHRLVMEHHIGRYLLPDEVVHHIDGNPSNNDISNLKLYASHSEHIKENH